MTARPSLTRRTLLGYGAGLAAAAPARAQEPAPPTESVQGAADAADRLTVETRIDGRGPFRFLVDTGADRTLIATELAAQLGAPDSGGVVVQGIVSAVPAATVRLTNLAFGPVVLDSLRAPILPRAALGADGILGLDAIGGRRVTFDFAHHALSIERAHSAVFPDHLRPSEAALPLAGRDNRLVSFDCHVDGVRADAFVDSGAEVTIANTALFEALREATGQPLLTGPPVVLTGVTAGTALGRLANVSRVKFGALTFTDGVLVVCDLPVFGIWGLARKPAMLFGMNFLKRTDAVTIDYGRKELRFRVAALRVASRA